MTEGDKKVIEDMTDEQLRNIYRFKVKTDSQNMKYFVEENSEEWIFFMRELESRCGIPEDLELRECHEEPLSVQKKRLEKEKKVVETS